MAGPPKSGKTHFCHRLAYNNVPIVDQRSNFVDTYNKTVQLGPVSLRVQLIDTDTQMFDVTMNKQFLRNLSGVFVCCPVELDEETMDEIEHGPIEPTFGESHKSSSKTGTKRSTRTQLEDEGTGTMTEDNTIFKENLQASVALMKSFSQASE